MPQFPITASEELADFEQASKPRRRPFTLDQFLSLFIGAVLVFWAVLLLLIAMQRFKASSSDNLILGVWRSNDHPAFLELRFDKGGLMRITTKQSHRFDGLYQFLAQQTIELTPFDMNAGPPIQARIRFGGATMTMTDSTGVVSHWERR
jgi:hypothetical protein